MAQISAPTASLIQNPSIPFSAWRLRKGTINALTEAQLEGASESCDRWERACAAIVVLAVVAELALAIIHPSYDSLWNRVGSAIADAAIAIGIVGEVWFGRRDARIQTELRRRSNDRLAGAENRAAEAQEELSRYRAPRNDRLTPEARQLIIDRLKVFPGIQFDTGLAAGPGEPMHFLWQLDEVLRNARWNHLDWQPTGPGILTTSGSPYGGRYWINGLVWADDVEIHIQQSEEPALKPAGDALIAALNEVGIAARFAGYNTHSANPNTIHILIGLKQ